MPVYDSHSLHYGFRLCLVLGLVLSMLTMTMLSQAGGGMVLRDDVCIVQVGFYEAHFTAYQPQSQGNEEFCQVLPDTGEALFVLDYLHDSLKEVQVDFRIIRNVTKLGEFANLADVEALGDLADITVFFHPGEIRHDGSLQVTHSFGAAGEYIGVVSAGHPTKSTVYRAAFPFSVGRVDYEAWFWRVLALVAVMLALWQAICRFRPHGELSA